jgi:hypothetical protein
MMILRLTFTTIIWVGLQTGAFAQQHHPYAGMQMRSVKALSDQQIADLKAGRGMGYALAAELNGYPGPAHVLELSKELSLSEAQRRQVEAMFANMKAEAIPLGERLIALETDLDRQFASKAITPVSLKTAMDRIGATQGELRAAHLKYHLMILDALTPQQVVRYSELRGYANARAHQH